MQLNYLQVAVQLVVVNVLIHVRNSVIELVRHIVLTLAKTDAMVVVRAHVKLHAVVVAKVHVMDVKQLVIVRNSKIRVSDYLCFV